MLGILQQAEDLVRESDKGSTGRPKCPPEISLHEGHLALVGEPEQWFNSIAGYSQPHTRSGANTHNCEQEVKSCVMEAGRGGRVLDGESWAGDKNGVAIHKRAQKEPENC